MSTANASRVDYDAVIAEIKIRIAAAQRARVRAEHDRDAAAAKAEEARQQLAAEFGVSTVDEAKAKLTELEGALSRTVSELSTLLDEMGA